MKTPEEIAKEFWGFDFIDDVDPLFTTIWGDSDFLELIKIIQEDAYKQGIDDAQQN